MTWKPVASFTNHSQILSWSRIGYEIKSESGLGTSLRNHTALDSPSPSTVRPSLPCSTPGNEAKLQHS